MDDEPLLGAEQLVRNDERADRVVGGAAAGVADHMRVAFREAGVFRRIEARVHAGEDRKAARRRQRQLALRSEACDISGVGRQNFIENLAHLCFPPVGAVTLRRAYQSGETTIFRDNVALRREKSQ
jgi:hypothetical protein